MLTFPPSPPKKATSKISHNRQLQATPNGCWEANLGVLQKRHAIVCWTTPQIHLPASLTYNLGSQPIFPAHSCEVKLPSPPQQLH